MAFFKWSSVLMPSTYCPPTTLITELKQCYYTLGHSTGIMPCHLVVGPPAGSQGARDMVFWKLDVRFKAAPLPFKLNILLFQFSSTFRVLSSHFLSHLTFPSICKSLFLSLYLFLPLWLPVSSCFLILARSAHPFLPFCVIRRGLPDPVHINQ